MKTAMQMALNDISNISIEKKSKEEIIGFCIGILIASIEIEKDQLVNSYISGKQNMLEIIEFKENANIIQAEEYYNQTYNQNK